MRFSLDTKWSFWSVSQALAVLLLSTSGFASPGPLQGMEFVEIPEGIYMYGRLVDCFGEVIAEGEPVIINGFEIMTTEVLCAQWGLVMVDLPDEVHLDSTSQKFTSGIPIVHVNLYDCLEFIDSLNVIDSTYVYRLPSFSEWLYACRATTYTPYFWGEDTLETISHYCWVQSNSDGLLHDVGTRIPNQWGLYDMCGNAIEWTLYGDGYETEDMKTGGSIIQHPLGGGSYLSNALACRPDRCTLGDSSYRYMDTGFRVVRTAQESPEETYVFQYRPIDEDLFAVFGEAALSVGGISHDFEDDDIEQFGYDVKGGCEQDGAYFRVGFGKYFGRFCTFLYGEIGHQGPGALLDNHGPWILPEVLLSMTDIGGGLELRYLPFRARFGFDSYTGTAHVDYDTVGSGSPGSWSTSIEDGRGYHFGIGVMGAVNETFILGLEYVQHIITLKLGASSTGAVPEEHNATQWEVRFFANAQMVFDLL
jgi:formylglycine-generating enzyme required for sulfatase activity